MVGQNTYYCLKRFMYDYKVSINQGVRECTNQQAQLNDCISYIPSKVLEKKGGITGLQGDRFPQITRRCNTQSFL